VSNIDKMNKKNSFNQLPEVIQKIIED